MKWDLGLAHDHRPHRLRRTVQFVFLGVCLFIGVRFVEFYQACLHSPQPAVSRPPGVDAFLPISALVSARFWLQTGVVHPVHPAGLLIFAAVVGLSLVFKRSFCSWVCPFGLLSEMLAGLGGRLRRRHLKLPHWVDLPLRGLKYLLLAFFAYVIFGRMDAASLRAFLDSPFNQLADVRLLEFFLPPGTITLVVLAILVVASIFIRQFWCRYLCPYGALTALAGLASPARIRRELPSCIDCAKCTRSCPASLPVHRLVSVRSDECSLCLECLEACPVPHTLAVKVAGSRRRVRPLILGLSVAGAFLLVVLVGRLTGHWQSSVTAAQAAALLQSAVPAP